MIKNVVKVHFNMLMGLNILVIFKMIKDLAMVKCNGMMVLYIKDFGLMV